MEPIVNAYFEYKNLLSNIDFNKQVLSEEKDAEMREMAKAELDEQQERLPKLEDEIHYLLIPKDPEDEKMPFWKYGQALVVMRQVFCTAICCVCI